MITNLNDFLKESKINEREINPNTKYAETSKKYKGKEIANDILSIYNGITDDDDYVIKNTLSPKISLSKILFLLTDNDVQKLLDYDNFYSDEPSDWSAVYWLVKNKFLRKKKVNEDVEQEPIRTFNCTMTFKIQSHLSDAEQVKDFLIDEFFEIQNIFDKDITVKENVETNEIFGFSEEEKTAKLAKQKEEALQIIKKHPMKNKTHLDLIKNYPERVDKHINFIIKNPEVKYYSWDDTKQDFINKGVHSVASGEGLAGK